MLTSPNYSPTMRSVRLWFNQIDEKDRVKRLLDWGEEQPHLYGFLINLSDDFGDLSHNGLMYLPLILSEAFRRLGMPVHPIGAEILEEVLKDAVHSGLVLEGESARMQSELRLAWLELAGEEAIDLESLPATQMVCRILVNVFEKAVPEKLQ